MMWLGDSVDCSADNYCTCRVREVMVIRIKMCIGTQGKYYWYSVM